MFDRQVGPGKNASKIMAAFLLLTTAAAFLAGAPRRPLAAASLPPPPPPRAAQCSSDLGCSLNGVCTAGACICDGGWVGGACDRLDLLPMAAPVYGWAPNVTSWGGSVNQGDDGKWHLHVSEIINGCGLHYWDRNSQCTHAVADSPTGPFVKADVALPVWAHSCRVRRVLLRPVGRITSAAQWARDKFAQLPLNTQPSSSPQIPRGTLPRQPGRRFATRPSRQLGCCSTSALPSRATAAARSTAKEIRPTRRWWRVQAPTNASRPGG